MLRVALGGSHIPGVVRPGFTRSWSVLVVDDMYEACNAESMTVETSPDSDGTVVVDIEQHGSARRMVITVKRDVPMWFSSFELSLTASVAGRIVLPLTLGPIAIAQTLSRPLTVASWSRKIAITSILRMVDGSANSLDAPTHRIFEAQAASSTIASATWDPGVVLAAHVASAWADGTLMAEEHTRDAAAHHIRCVELGCGVDIAGLALAAAARETDARVALTDGSRDACALARQNARQNGLSAVVRTEELIWGCDVSAVCSAVGGRPNLILAADIIYRHETFGPLVRTLAALCDASRSASEPPPVVLLAYRPRVDDAHFWHLLLEEFSLETIMPSTRHRPKDTPTGVHRAPAACDPLSDPLSATSTASGTRIYRLHRRSCREPSACRICRGRGLLAPHVGAPAASSSKLREVCSLAREQPRRREVSSVGSQ